MNIIQSQLFQIFFIGFLVSFTVFSSESTPPDKPTGIIHVVREGEILLKISERYGVSFSSILRANPLADPSHIMVGQKILIPTDSVSFVTDFAQSLQEKPQEITHIVLQGESLAIIARRYGAPLGFLMNLNQLENPSHIIVGQKIRIPVDLIHSVTPDYIASPPKVIETIVASGIEDATGNDDAPSLVSESIQVVEEEISNATRQELVKPAPVKTSEEAIPDSPMRFHVVQEGEILNKIAARYGVAYESLLAVNSLENPSHILVGQKIRIPSDAKNVNLSEPEKTTEREIEHPNEKTDAKKEIPSIGPLLKNEKSKPEEQTLESTHLIVEGDTLVKIGRRYNVSMQALMKANDLVNPSLIMVGQAIRIPANAPPFVEPVLQQDASESKPVPTIKFPRSHYIEPETVIFRGNNNGIYGYATIFDVRENLLPESKTLATYLRLMVLVNNLSVKSIYLSPKNISLQLTDSRVVEPFDGIKLDSGGMWFFPKIVEWNGVDISADNVVIQQLRQGEYGVLDVSFTMDGVVNELEVLSQCKLLDVRVIGEEKTRVILSVDPYQPN
ncbi:MAG: LysM peptidoglycan-binding domain-containing protein [Candidatus Omnitrophota bacterium]|jgi:LysM repeat protein|nr:MAG: LysM peptidoglycan-binding domain-containing protein [Candidatus Omnitrophota bacterium]